MPKSALKGGRTTDIRSGGFFALPPFEGGKGWQRWRASEMIDDLKFGKVAQRWRD
jgi:hypothetical protein